MGFYWNRYDVVSMGLKSILGVLHGGSMGSLTKSLDY